MKNLPPKRRDERGAAVFVVVMAIALLTGVGLFAAHSATLVDQAAGFTRLARQTQYLGEYGMLAASAELGDGTAAEYVGKLESSTTSATISCSANAGVSGVVCFKFSTNTLDGRTMAVTGTKLIEATAPDGTPGSLGKSSSAKPDIQVQLTELSQASRPVAGCDVGSEGCTYRKVTATTRAQLLSSDVACSDQSTTTIGQQVLRAQLLIGPMQR